jgi:corrinoid protein of di/trimethylamine methyltransferase
MFAHEHGRFGAARGKTRIIYSPAVGFNITEILHAGLDVLKLNSSQQGVPVSVHSDILEKLSNSVIEGNSEAAKTAASEALKAQIDPLEAIENGLAKGLREVGRRFECGEMFLMQLILSGEAMKTGVKIMRPEMLRQEKQLKVSGSFFIGTVEGDIHDIGKSIVAAMLTAEGFDVIDGGVDIPDKVFVNKTRELKPQIIGLSALMTTTRTKQKDVIDALKQAGLRNAVKVMVGGATVTPEWAQQIGADAYGEDAIDAPKKARQLLGG